MNLPLTATYALAVIAFILTIINGVNGKIPLWIPVLFLCIIFLIPRG